MEQKRFHALGGICVFSNTNNMKYYREMFLLFHLKYEKDHKSILILIKK